MILSIDYDEGAEGTPGATVAASYRGVTGWVRDDLPTDRWFSGDPVADWRTALDACEKAGYGGGIMLSSMCDHFVSDCRGVFGWDVDPVLGDVITRNTAEEAARIDAAITAEDAKDAAVTTEPWPFVDPEIHTVGTIQIPSGKFVPNPAMETYAMDDGHIAVSRRDLANLYRTVQLAKISDEQRARDGYGQSAMDSIAAWLRLQPASNEPDLDLPY